MSELTNLESYEELIEFAINEFREKFNLADRTEMLQDFLEKCGLQKSQDKYYSLCNNFEHFEKPKYVVIGASAVQDSDIYNIFEEFGIDESQVELYTDFKLLKKLDISKFRNKDKYAGILISAMQHSTISKSRFSSPIARLESEKAFFPPFRKLSANKELKITSTNLKESLSSLLGITPNSL